MFVKPGADVDGRARVVRRRAGHPPMPAEGHEVDEGDMFWARRLRDGDVVESDTPLSGAHKELAG